jgi:hypothetical protein
LEEPNVKNTTEKIPRILSYNQMVAKKKENCKKNIAIFKKVTTPVSRSENSGVRTKTLATKFADWAEWIIIARV